MQLVINIFTIFGSILGILAFLLTIFSSFHEHNKLKWEKLSLIINFNDFEEFCNGVSNGIIYSRQSNKFREFTRLIRNNSEEVQFKGIAKKKIDLLFSKILSETNIFYSEVQAPKWDVWKKDREDVERIINKDYFDAEFDTVDKHSKEISQTRQNATNSVEEIIRLYREIYALSNRLPYEFILKRK